MADIVFVAIALAFFALCVLYVRWCDLIIGPDEVSSSRSARGRRRGPACRRGGGMIAAGYDNWVGLVLAALAVVYLVLVLIFPERF